MKKIKLFIISLLCFFLPGCNNNSIDYYANKKPKVDLRSFFHGDVEGWGALFDYQGRQIRSFHVSIKGDWDKNNGKLKEWFVFDDGEKTERVWELNFTDDTAFVGRANDVIGEAKGSQNGNAANLHYVLNVPYKGSSINLNMDDWMYLAEDNILLNRTSMKKFGFKVGELFIFMRKKQ